MDGGFQPLTGYLSLFLLVWIIAYAVSKRFRLERYGLETVSYTHLTLPTN